MNARTRLGIAAGFFACAPALLAAPRAVPAAGLQTIQHVIFIVQENRSFDHYFGTFPGADGFPSPLPCLPSISSKDLMPSIFVRW